MKKHLLTTTAVCLLMLVAQAHEFWMQPVKFFLSPGDHLVLNFKVGENFMGEPWDLSKHRVTTLELFHLSAQRKLVDSVKAGEEPNLMVKINDEGTHLVAMQSNAAFIELEAAKFNDYLKEDGLDDAYAARESKKLLDKPGKELYTRHAKLLVQVGNKTDDTYKQVVGFPLEIIPESNPYALRKGDPLRFRILANGKPLFGAKVRIWNRHDNRTTIQNIYTEKSGVVETRVSNGGAWMVSVVQMVPSKDPTADWQSHWASLVFGIQ